MPRELHLDGKTLEGGGQLIRIALGMSALTSKSVVISDIRGNRPGGGGLKPQHLTAVKWLAGACHAELEGAETKSRVLHFRPNRKGSGRRRKTPKRAGQHEAEARTCTIDMSSPGSIGFVFQAILPFILFTTPDPQTSGPFVLTIKGGTNVSFSPSYDYISHVLLPNLGLAGLPTISANLESRGWSTGRTEVGSATFHITPLASGASLSPFSFKDRGAVRSIAATILAPQSILLGIKTQVLSHLVKAFPDIPSSIALAEDSRQNARLYLLLVATSTAGYKLGADLLYPYKVKCLSEAATKLVEKVTADLQEELEYGGCVDKYMQDQLVVYQALAQGRSVVNAGRRGMRTREPSLHTKTARWVASEMLGVTFDDDGECEGVGHAVGGKQVVIS